MIQGIPYLSDQLIAYIGNKRKLIGLISRAIGKTGLDGGVFMDLFSGSGSVARLAKCHGFSVIANDWEPYSQIINRAYIKANCAPAFEAFGGLDAAIAILNDLPGVPGYISTSYCPADDEDYDVLRERMFYTQRNGRRIDAIREQIKIWRDEEMISELEESVLLAPLIFQASYCSNTSGVFKGFHNGWGGATKTAWYRIRSDLTLKAPIFCDNGQSNVVYRQDAAELAKKVTCDIVYLDPPYNQHQYGSNYHLLNTIALWDKPGISRYITEGAIGDKSAIRKDWRTSRKSLYCNRSSAVIAFADLIENLDAGFILVSYSTEGQIHLDDMLGIMAKRGALDVVVQAYKRYRVSSQRPSAKPHTTEFVAIVDTGKPSNKDDISRVRRKILSAQDSHKETIA